MALNPPLTRSVDERPPSGGVTFTNERHSCPRHGLLILTSRIVGVHSLAEAQTPPTNLRLDQGPWSRQSSFASLIIPPTTTLPWKTSRSFPLCTARWPLHGGEPWAAGRFMSRNVPLRLCRSDSTSNRRGPSARVLSNVMGWSRSMEGPCSRAHISHLSLHLREMNIARRPGWQTAAFPLNYDHGLLKRGLDALFSGPGPPGHSTSSSLRSAQITGLTFRDSQSSLTYLVEVLDVLA